MNFPSSRLLFFHIKLNFNQENKTPRDKFIQMLQNHPKKMKKNIEIASWEVLYVTLNHLG